MNLSAAVPPSPDTQDGPPRELGLGLWGRLTGRSLSNLSSAPYAVRMRHARLSARLQRLDRRPFFTYWLCAVQTAVLMLVLSLNVADNHPSSSSLLTGMAPFGLGGLAHRTGLVFTEFLTLEQVGSATLAAAVAVVIVAASVAVTAVGTSVAVVILAASVAVVATAAFSAAAITVAATSTAIVDAFSQNVARIAAVSFSVTYYATFLLLLDCSPFKLGFPFVFQVDVFEPSNLWLGPSALGLVRAGAGFAPCMRPSSSALATALDSSRSRERRSGCCVRNDRSGCAQTAPEHCSPVLSEFREGTVCGLDPRHCASPASAPPFQWGEDITKWPLCKKRRDWGVGNHRTDSVGETSHMKCDVVAR